MKIFARNLVVLALVAILGACSGKRNIAMKVHSDPQGAYALMQVKEEGNEQADWVFLGPTPVVTNREVRFGNASSVSLKVIRPGFYEQVKTWSGRDFLKEYKTNREIVWVPNMVKQ